MKKALHISLIMCLLASLCSCDKSCRVGIGDYISRTIVLDSINSIGIGIQSNLILRNDSIQSVNIEAQQNVIEDLNTEVVNGFWAIDQLGLCLEIDKPIGLNLRLTDLKALVLNSNSEVVFANAFDGLDRLELASNASGNILARGSSNTLQVALNGEGSINAFEFKCVEAIIVLQGSGNVELDVSGKLTVEINGSGNVFYRGDPQLDLTLNGSGKVIKI